MFSTVQWFSLPSCELWVVSCGGFKYSCLQLIARILENLIPTVKTYHWLDSSPISHPSQTQYIGVSYNIFTMIVSNITLISVRYNSSSPATEIQNNKFILWQRSEILSNSCTVHIRVFYPTSAEKSCHRHVPKIVYVSFHRHPSKT